MNNNAPHRMGSGMADKAADGASRAVREMGNTARQLGNTVMTALDGPPQDLLGVKGPHRMIDSLANAGLRAGENFMTNGVIGSAKQMGEGISQALDQPMDQLGNVGDLGAKMPFK